MFQKARDNSVPLDTIERAVKRGTGELEGVNYEAITYEGYAPGGVALLIEVLTDNRNRTGSEIRSLLTKNGGSLAEPGAVAWQFERKGVVRVDRAADEDELMMTGLEHGAEDVTDGVDAWDLTCEAGDVTDLRTALEGAGFTVTESDATMVAKNTVPMSDHTDVKAVLRLLDLLDDHEDVQDIHSNVDIPDDVLEAVS
jgi:YebC/PmpR family DNA-binding regulatory protein